MKGLIIRDGNINDIPFIVETIVEAEKSGTNIFSYNTIFGLSEEEAKKYIEKGDLLILISSSGNSNNLKKVLDYTNKIKVRSIGFCGFDGGYLKKKCSVAVHSKIDNYGVSEDINHILMHLFHPHLLLYYLQFDKTLMKLG